MNKKPHVQPGGTKKDHADTAPPAKPVVKKKTAPPLAEPKMREEDMMPWMKGMAPKNKGKK